jgi:hypothetical protein
MTQGQDTQSVTQKIVHRLLPDCHLAVIRGCCADRYIVLHKIMTGFLDLPLFIYITQRTVGEITKHLQASRAPEGRGI